ncbi:Putative Vacuolar assembly protein DID2 [Rhizopus microsporus]|nr:Putative Vacuolar assembly protein DID2 [Rhizopus microsporus]
MNGLENQLFQLKFTAKQLNKQSKRCQKDEQTEKNKLKKAIQDGNMEGARIYASNAIRKKNESLNLLKLSSRIDAVASRVQTAITMRKVSTSMANVVKGMGRAMETMNLEQVIIIKVVNLLLNSIRFLWSWTSLNLNLKTWMFKQDIWKVQWQAQQH